jgi:uncharacterized protein
VALAALAFGLASGAAIGMLGGAPRRHLRRRRAARRPGRHRVGDAVSGRSPLAAFAVAMVLAAGAMWRKAGRGALDVLREPSCPPLRIARGLAAAPAVRALTGFFGVGGGFLIVPTLAVVLALSVRLAVGTSLTIITATSAMALAAHLAAGRGVDLALTAAMTTGCVVGALCGAAMAGRVPRRELARGFAGLVTAVAAYLVVSTAFLGGPS